MEKTSNTLLTTDTLKTEKQKRDYLLILMHPLEKRISDQIPFGNSLKELETFKNELPKVCKDKLAELKRYEERLGVAKIQRNNILQTYPELAKCEIHLLVGAYTLLKEQENINRWKKYWKRLNPNYKVSQKKGGLSEQDVQRARTFPIQELLDKPWRIAGANKLKTYCPFHKERTPSFIIYTNDNTAHCFGCGQHIKNAIDFLITRDHLEFKEAVRRLI
jgi:hypothetical protein